MNNLEKILEFMHLVGKLKTTERFKSSDNCVGDSVAEHSWRVALLSVVLAKELDIQVNVSRSVRLALAHDLAESITDDIDARLIEKKVHSQKEKDEKEFAAMEKIENMLPEKIGREMKELWHEYFLGKTEEAKFVKTVDKIEAIMHVGEVSTKGADDLLENYGKKEVSNFPELQEFFDLSKQEAAKKIENISRK